ncbi:hypothetical protein ABB37_03739 [Leptomonas pyrrhocoris]|uniref:Uncharacterized protein n=1 Tax=Leptomonas pyrrhocoris TaxID=157538 RepID=A0A0N0DWC0_LEPPY|nr:hypothetical protein ABB37_03739 [Leptomonas pyrrhocoris]KPA81354.1 hypothetical protein ABB37_03739 [Leptomonas pyrrhocoris]|eukprot:XP_015659793.1 hypothetical protein ABB37_03739 [Leptomonas pyrrhocoris]
MVLLVVKGTVYPDEFVVERKLSDAVSASPTPPSDKATSTTTAGASPSAQDSIVPIIAHLLNTRHQLRLVLMSAQELATLFTQHHKEKEMEESEAKLVGQYTARIEELHKRLKDTKSPVRDDEFDHAVAELRVLTSLLYPSFCTHAEGTEAAIQRLYAQHDDPDLDEDTRLLVYHCRVIVDPDWKASERVKEDEAALWFCGKPMENTLVKYAGRNEKSKIIVKVAPRAGPAPSGEPRMRYEDQRALYKARCERRETYKQLEESELRDRVVQQTRGAVQLSLGVRGAANSTLSSAVTDPTASDVVPALKTERLRPIYPQKEERELPIS